MKTIITNATIVSYDKTIEGEISFEKGVITEISKHINKDNAEIIDAKDCYVLPGAVDIHTHLAKGANGKINKEAYKQNSLASLYGGTTTIIEEIDVNNLNTSSLEEYIQVFKNQSYIDYSFHQQVTKEESIDKDKVEELTRIANNGFPSVTLSMCGENYQNDENILKVLREFSRYGATSFIRCESNAPIKLLEELHTIKNRLSPYAIATTRPNYTESEAFIRLSNLSRAGSVAFCADNISTKEVVDILISQVREGLPISISVNPLHLIFTDDVYKTHQIDDIQGYKYLVSPPLRKRDDIDALWRAIANGYIHFVSSNHNATHLKHKLEYAKNDIFNCPTGVPGAELRLSLLHTFGVLKNKISINKLVEITATHVTRIAGLRTKGRIEAGTDADIVIFDPNHKKTITKDILHDTCDYTPYEGMELQGFAKHVFLRGEHVIKNFEAEVKSPTGLLMFRKPIAMR